MLLLPVKTTLKLHLNLLSNKGFYSVKVFFIKLLCGRAQLSDGVIEYENTNDMFFNSNMDNRHLNLLLLELAKRINLNDFEIFLTFGVQQNAYITALVCGGVSGVLSAIVSFLRLKYKNMNQILDIDPNYKKDAFELTSTVTISINLLNVIIAWFKAKAKFKEMEYEELKQN